MRGNGAYRAAHHIIKAHAKVWHTYDTQWREKQKDSRAGRKSVQQGLGTSRLPTFSPQEKSYIKGTCDFLGIGHFTTRYITHRNDPPGRSSNSYFTDRDLAELVDPRWPDPGSEWLYSVPWGFRRLLNFVKVQSRHAVICAKPKVISAQTQSN
ncbi:hypothetical protein XENOCAPTIV_025000 [Xenoophorus captivus]|uniref:Ndc10 domain-containing protein n=1 Tax=Xenoophorus captivus TaxID=1517983 RepID=A0ABV0S3D4_9TELE